MKPDLFKQPKRPKASSHSTALHSSGFSSLLVGATVVCLGVLLYPQLSISRVDLNDNVYHLNLIEHTVEALRNGGNPIDFWVGEWTFGYAVPRTYHSLSHLLTALILVAAGKSLSSVTLFVWVRYLLLCFFPVTVFASGRLFGLSARSAAAAALLSPWIATNALYGIELGSYVWRGSGLFPQSLSMHLLLLSLGFGYRALRSGRGVVLAGTLLGLTFLSHFVYGYIGAASLVLFAAIALSRQSVASSVTRLVLMGGVAFLLSAGQILALFEDGPLINRCRWEHPWKWDSFGASEVWRLAVSGELFDAGRLPLFSLLVLLGILVLLCRLLLPHRADDTRSQPGLPAVASLSLLSGLFLWLLLFCGRPTWGSTLYTLLGAPSELHLHRLIGAVHLFSIPLAGIGLAATWTWFRRLPRFAGTLCAALLTILILFPILKERSSYLSQGARWGRENLEVYAREKNDIDLTLSEVSRRPGRVFAGLAASWGREFKVGQVPFYAFLTRDHIPALSFLYHSMALTSDIMVRFNEGNPDQYRLFNVSSVVMEAGRPVSPFLADLHSFGRFKVFSAPGNGYFDLVSVPYSTTIDKKSFYEVNDRFLASDWVRRRAHLLLQLSPGSPSPVPSLSPKQELPPVETLRNSGSLENEWEEGGIHGVDVTLPQAGYILFKMTFHPNWQARVDGRQVDTVMLSPGFIGVPLNAGRHSVVLRYQPGWLRLVLFLAGLLLLVPALLLESRGAVTRLEAVVQQRAVAWIRQIEPVQRRRLLAAAGLVLLAFPVCLPLLTGALPGGHDCFEYFPRQIEFHENIRHGTLLPRWAADLSSGYGQPFFLLNPPLLYYLTEPWLWLGLDPIASLNATCILLILAAGAGMFLLASLLWGRSAAWIGSAAFLYAPYFHVDLFVRRALAEFTAFCLYPLALYGFVCHARKGNRAALVLGALAYSGILMSHHPAALVFSILLGFFILFDWARHRSWSVLLQQGGGVLLALGFSAWVWLPGLIEMGDASLNRLLEGYLHYPNHFVYLHQLLYSPWGFGLSVPGDGDGMSFSLGWSHLLIIVGAYAALCIGRGREKAPADFLLWLGLLIFFCLLMLPQSLWLWQHLPLLEYLEFPWRILAPASLCLSILVALSSRFLQRLPYPRAALAVAMVLLVVPNLTHLGPPQYHDVRLDEWTPREIARRGIAVTTRREYEPRWLKTPLPWMEKGFRISEGRAEVVETVFRPSTRFLEVESEGVRLDLSVAYFPGWTLILDGNQLKTEPSEQGILSLEVPPGRHRVEARFRRTTSRWLGDALSLLCFAVAAAFLLLVRPRPRLTTR